MPKREFVKMQIQSVLIEKDDNGTVTGELISQPINCFSLEEVAQWWAKSQEEVNDFNAQQPNRAARRRKS